jgi:hypothetical protein
LKEIAQLLMALSLETATAFPAKPAKAKDRMKVREEQWVPPAGEQ